MVVVKSLDGSEEMFASSTVDTVDALKEAILERLGIALESQLLVYEEKELEAGTVLASLGISEDTKITLSTKEGETLREVFSCFDVNGDGTIDREELGLVLKEVDPEAWTDGRVDELFKSFDASKDAVIQVEEFCEWLGLVGVSGSTSLDALAKTMGEVSITSVSADVAFHSTYNDDADTHIVELKADGTYRETHEQRGTYKIIQSLVPMTAHKVVLYPLTESGYGWGGSGGDEWEGKDISSQGAACHSIEADLKTLRHSTDPPFRAKYIASGNDCCFRNMGRGANSGMEPQPAASATGSAARMVVPPDGRVAEAAKSARDISSFQQAVVAYGCSFAAHRHPFGALEQAVQAFSTTAFFTDLLPFVCDRALEYARLFHAPINIIDKAALEADRVVEWTQRQCLCILCNAFLCAWPERTSDNCRSHEVKDNIVLPSINFDEMFISRGNFQAQVAKCQMFLHYLEKQRNRLSLGDQLSRLVSFVRARADAPDWCNCTQPLCSITVRPLGESIDAAKDMLRADFANESVGGGSLAYGCVQEEIMFACHPELNCARLVFTSMMRDEAFILCGAEQFAEPAGYAMALKCRGSYDDPTPVVDGRLQACITAIDAMDYRGRNANVQMQYTQDFVKRELLKAYAGFAVPKGLNAPSTLATGNWGAGAFLGDASLKALVQWVAASEAGLDMHYFPFDNRQLHEDLPKVVHAILERKMTVADLSKFILEDLDARGHVLHQLNRALGLDLLLI